jgi:hypothetical protein
MNTFARRVLSAAVLDRRMYEEVEADASATGQAVGVVVLASVAGTSRADGVCVVGWALPLVVAAVIGILFAPTVSRRGW